MFICACERACAYASNVMHAFMSISMFPHANTSHIHALAQTYSRSTSPPSVDEKLHSDVSVGPQEKRDSQSPLPSPSISRARRTYTHSQIHTKVTQGPCSLQNEGSVLVPLSWPMSLSATACTHEFTNTCACTTRTHESTRTCAHIHAHTSTRHEPCHSDVCTRIHVAHDLE